MYSLSVEKGNVVYKYGADKFVSFEFNLLSEVGAPYQKWFIDEIERRGWVIERGVDLDRPPWIADRLISIIKGPK